MSNCARESSDRQCSQTLNNMDAKTACQQVKNRYDEMEKMVDALEDWSPAGILKALGAQNKTDVDIKNMINNLQESLQNIDVQGVCKNKISSIQSNILDNTECVTALKDNPQALKILLDKIGNISNITMENKNTNIQQCVISTYIQALNKQEANIDNSALIQIMQKASGLLSNNESKLNQCQFVSNRNTACTYVKSTSCCFNDNSNVQENILKCVGANNVILRNQNDNLQFCNLSGNTTLSADQLSKLSNKAESKVQQISEGVSPLVLLLFLLIPFLLMGGGTLAFSKFAKDFMPIIGLIPMIAGIIAIAIYFNSKNAKINKTIQNKPLEGSNCDYNYYKGDISTTYKQANYNCNQDPNCQAVDFVYSVDSNNKPESIDSTINEGYPFNINGSAIYYSGYGSYCDEDPKDDKKYFVLYKNKPASISYPIIGGCLIFVGIIFIIISLKKVYTTTTKQA